MAVIVEQLQRAVDQNMQSLAEGEHSVLGNILMHVNLIVCLLTVTRQKLHRVNLLVGSY